MQARKYHLARRMLLGLAGLSMASTTLASPVVGQSDNFEDGTTDQWAIGTRASASERPRNIPSGGPAGAGDPYLLVTSKGGTGPASRLIVQNLSTRWKGNFIAGGVGAIDVDLENFGTTALPMRMVLGSGSGNGYVTNAVSLPADGQWHHVLFSLDASNMHGFNGPQSYPVFLKNVGVMRILAEASAGRMGEPVAGSFGADNIRALPEPGAIGFLMAATGTLARRRAR